MNTSGGFKDLANSILGKLAYFQLLCKDPTEENYKETKHF